MLEMYTVVSLAFTTDPPHLTTSNRLAVSQQDAMKLESAEFGEPYFRVLRAYKKIERAGQ